jgi:hypothetical protein
MVDLRKGVRSLVEQMTWTRTRERDCGMGVVGAGLQPLMLLHTIT